MTRATGLFVLFTAVLILRLSRSFAIDSPWRLPGDIIPHAYSIHLTTHVHTQTDFTYSGDVNITLSALITSPSITLHVKDLNLTSVLIWSAANVSAIWHPIERRYNETTEMLTMYVNGTSGGALLPGVEYVMRLRFVGILRTDLRGFYRMSYEDESGNNRWLATTQFSPIDARSAFPCLDEPALRATFAVRITHGSNFTAMSNMPVDGTPNISADDRMTTTIFQTTPPMPTYLLAFTVSDFLCKSDATREVQQRICARPAFINSTQVDFGLEMGASVLNAFEQYFGIPYALPKIDQALIPDMRPGAMENWGLVNYREDLLMYSDTDSTNSIFSKRLTARIIAHEYSHQWFGNHVTPKWWSYLWLSEGFATLFESISLDWIFPEWRFHDEFVFTTQRRILEIDATEDTNAMSREVETIDDLSIANFANSIAYHKAACVLRMFQHALTEDKFKKGLILYLNKFKNSAADERDLFDALEEAIRPDGKLPNVHVATLMSSWTQQAGYPLVTVTRNYHTGYLTFDQERYTDHIANTLVATQPWWIPVNFASASLGEFYDTTPDFWIGTRNMTMRLSERTLKSTDWLLLNKRQTGYYRVRYDVQNYKLMAAELLKNPGCIHVTSRYQLVDDTFELARAARLNYDVVFDLIKYLQTETDYLPWMSAISGLGVVDRCLESTVWFDAYARFMSTLLTHVYNETGIVGHESESVAIHDARNIIVQMACRYGNTQCLNETRNALIAHLSAANKAPHRLNLDYESEVMCGALRHRDSAHLFDALLLQLQRSRERDERRRLIDGLACSGLADQLDVLLTLSVNLTWYNPKERYLMWKKVLSAGPTGSAAAIAFITDFFKEAAISYKSYMHSAVEDLAYRTSTNKQLLEFDRFIEVAHGMNFTLFYNKEQELREKIRENLIWMNRNAEVIHMWMKTNNANNIH